MAEASLQSKDALLSAPHWWVCEHNKLLEVGVHAAERARYGRRQKQDPSSRPAGEEGESAHHFDIQLPPIVPWKSWTEQCTDTELLRLPTFGKKEQKQRGALNEITCFGWVCLIKRQNNWDLQLKEADVLVINLCLCLKRHPQTIKTSQLEVCYTGAALRGAPRPVLVKSKALRTELVCCCFFFLGNLHPGENKCGQFVCGLEKDNSQCSMFTLPPCWAAQEPLDVLVWCWMGNKNPPTTNREGWNREPGTEEEARKGRRVDRWTLLWLKMAAVFSAGYGGRRSIRRRVRRPAERDGDAEREVTRNHACFWTPTVGMAAGSESVLLAVMTPVIGVSCRRHAGFVASSLSSKPERIIWSDQRLSIAGTGASEEPDTPRAQSRLFADVCSLAIVARAMDGRIWRQCRRGQRGGFFNKIDPVWWSEL